MIAGILTAVFIVFGISAGWLMRDTLHWEDMDIDYTIEELHADCWDGLHLKGKE